MIALMVLTDGCRDGCLDRTVTSAKEALPWDDFDIRVLVTDSPHAARLGERYDGDFAVCDTGARRAGFAGTIAAGWHMLRGVDHLFHLEDDFTFNRPVPLYQMRAILDRYPHLAQMSLLRQAWNASERAAGGVMQVNPENYAHWHSDGTRWVEQGAYFTTNPSLIPGAVVERGWPQVPNSEGIFTHQLLADGYRFGIWGAGEEWVEHIGLERTGNGY
jgi:hypothetical protein